MVVIVTGYTKLSKADLVRPTSKMFAVVG